MSTNPYLGVLLLLMCLGDRMQVGLGPSPSPLPPPPHASVPLPVGPLSLTPPSSCALCSEGYD